MSIRIADLEKQILQELDAIKKFDLQISLAWELAAINIEKMYILVEEMENSLKSFPYEKGHFSCLCLKAIYAVRKDEYFEAMKLANLAYDAFNSLGFIEGQARALRILSTVYGQLGKFDECLNICRKGLALVKEYKLPISEENNTPIEFTFLNNIAATYSYLGRHAEALDVNLEAYEYLKKGDRGSAQVLFMCNLGQSYLENNNMELALEHLNNALVESDQLHLENYYYHLCYSGLGQVYKKLGNYNLSMENFLMALAQAESSFSKYGQAEVLLHLGKLSIEMDQTDLAIENLERALVLAEDIKASELLRENHLLLAECFEKKRDYETSIFHYKRHTEVLKDVLSVELEQKLNEYTTDFKIEQAKKDAEIYKLKNVELKEKNIEIENKAKALEESYHNISTLSLIGQEITASLDIEKILFTIYNNVKTLMDASIFGIGTFDEATGIIDYKMYLDESVRLPVFQTSIDSLDSVASKCIRLRGPIVYSDIPELPSTHRLPGGNIATKGRVPKSLIYYPLILEDRVIGTITVQSYHPNSYTDVHLDAIRILASYIAIALNNSQQSEALKKAVNELELFSKTDPLTELYNRRYISEKINEECNRYKRNPHHFSIIITDIDFFKAVNDSYGHDCGDFVLKELSELLRGLLRKQDYIARWGGEEFLILLTQTDACSAAVMAERLRKKVMKHVFRYEEHEINITMTFGISEYNSEPNMDATIKRADRALYRGKDTGRNKCIINGLADCHIKDVEEM